ncbi:XIAP-associated factor 1 [Xenentodon cancila]
MDSKEAIRICGQCHKEVAEANFALHETHCSRFLCLCPECDEAVPKDQLKEHREEQHSLVKCSKCNKKIERRHLQDHESDECLERLQTCPFCELEVPWKNLDEHTVVCGSRTELCRDCGRYVKLTDWAEHSSVCSAQRTSINEGDPDKISTCRHCHLALPVVLLHWHEVKCQIHLVLKNKESYRTLQNRPAFSEL